MFDLGADHSIFNYRFAIYIPNKNRLDEELPDIEQWASEAFYVLFTAAGGATRLAPAQGMWFSKDEGKVIHEITHVVYAVVDPNTFPANLPLVLDFIHRFGRETMQDSVMVEYGSKLHFISDYHKAEEPPPLRIAN
jgi:hypothetical protein